MTKEEYESDPLSAEEFDAWKKKRSTRKVFYLLTQDKERNKDIICNGGTISFQDSNSTSQSTCRVVGVIEGINKILHMEVEEDEI